MSRRLVIIGVLGIVLIGGVYWYINRPPEPPPQPPALPRRVARPRPPPPPSPIKPPERKLKVVKPPVAVEPPAPVQKPADIPSKVPAPTEGTPPPAPSTRATPAEPRPAPQPQATAPAPEPPRARPYSVQVASLVLKRNAHALQLRLAKLGYQPTIHQRTARITRYRVTAGEFPDRAEADRTAHRLSAEGFAPKLVAGAHGKFAVEVGWSFNQNEAIDLARRLQQKHYTTQIVTKTAPTPVYAVRVGPYATKSEARQAVKALKRKGFAPVIVRRC